MVIVTTTDSTVSPGDDLFERRSTERTIINRGAMMFAAGFPGVHSCCVRDITNRGISVRLNGLNIVPPEFGISSDDFGTIRRCRLVWRDGDFVGAIFDG